MEVRISFSESKRAWLRYRGDYHPVATMRSSLFREIVVSQCPHAEQNPMLFQPEIDELTRWYILTRYPVKLFYLEKGVFVDR